MRMYLSKEEGIKLSYLLLNRVKELDKDFMTSSVARDEIVELLRINDRIEDCLYYQKSGYNRGRKNHGKN